MYSKIEISTLKKYRTWKWSNPW